jgi:CBS-domain-containing membrane protein
MTTEDAAWVQACRRFEAMTVAEADRLMAIEPILARPDEPLLALIRRAVASPACRVISVVDGAGRLIGLIPLGDLAFAAFVRVMPEVFLREAHGVLEGGEFARMAHARTAGEVMRPPDAVRPADTLERAYGRLLAAKLEGLPIADDAGRAIGYLNLPEFLGAWLLNCPPEAGEAAREGGA